MTKYGLTCSFGPQLHSKQPGRNFFSIKKTYWAMLSISEIWGSEVKVYQMSEYGQNLKIKSYSHNMTKYGVEYCFGSHDCIWCTLQRRFLMDSVWPRHTESTCRQRHPIQRQILSRFLFLLNPSFFGGSLQLQNLDVLKRACIIMPWMYCVWNVSLIH